MAEIEELNTEWTYEDGLHGRGVNKSDGAHGSHGARRGGGRHRHRAKRRVRDAVLIAVAIVLSAIVLLGAYFAISAVVVAKEVKSASTVVSSLSGMDLTSAETGSTLDATVKELDKHISVAYANTNNPVWRMMGALPWYGHDITAVRTTVESLHDLSHDALPLMVDAAGSVDQSWFGINDSAIAMPGIDKVSAKLVKANAIVQRANTKFQSIDGVTINALKNALTPAQKKMNIVAQSSDSLSRAVRLLPSMLGLNDPNETRTYLILAQGNAELRATGGVAGSWGTVTVQNGKITLNDFVSEGELEGISSPVTELSADELALYGDKLGRKPQDVNFTPDFQRTGTIAKAMWEQRFGQRIDGVLSIDPVLLQRVLSVVGSVQVNYKNYSPVLDGQSTSRVLLNEVYAALPDPEDQDEFFSLAATAAFNRMLHVQGSQSMQLIRQLAAAAQQGHVCVWSAHAEEQSVLDGTAVSGSLFTAKSPKYMGGKTPKQVIGVYFNDAMGSKMDWYLERKVTDTIVKTYSNGRERHEITISLRNTLNQADVDKVPGYVVGALENGAQKGDIQFINYLYVPTGGSVPEYAAGPDGGKGDNYSLHDGLTVISKQVNLKPGQSYEITATVYTAAGSVPGQTVLRQTPLLQ